MFIAEIDGQPVGQVRFDRIDGGNCVVSAYLLEKYTGRGLGVEAIRQGCERIFEEWPISRVIACVRQDNAAGHAGFRKAGFSETPETLCPSNHFALVLRRVAPAKVGAARP
jgi:RimJ/RimL family protein N-acetyltransferase